MKVKFCHNKKKRKYVVMKRKKLFSIQITGFSKISSIHLSCINVLCNFDCVYAKNLFVVWICRFVMLKDVNKLKK